MNEFMFEIAKILILLLGATLTYKVVPLIQGKVTAEQLNQIAFWVQIAVTAAEQIWQQSGKGPDKKAYVQEFLAQKGIQIDNEALDALIEAAVYELKSTKQLLYND